MTQIPTVITDPNFVTMLPNSIDYAELSIYRDLDFLALHGPTSLGTSTVGLNTLGVSPSVVVLEELYYGPNETPITPLSQAAIRAIYAGAPNGPPQYFAVIGHAAGGWVPSVQVLLGPAPDQAYNFIAYVTERQPPLSATNTTTFISQELPDLFWAAAMIYWAGYLKSFGSMADDPKLAISWEGEYQRLLKSANTEEMRKKFQSSNWQAQNPAPLAAQPRA